jgi:hypothetical protein
MSVVVMLVVALKVDLVEGIPPSPRDRWTWLQFKIYIHRIEKEL